MPIEYVQLQRAPLPPVCPDCGGSPFDPFMRGCVMRPWVPFIHGWNRRDFRHCVLICWKCKNIVGYEAPGLGYQMLRPYAGVTMPMEPDRTARRVMATVVLLAAAVALVWALVAM